MDKTKSEQRQIVLQLAFILCPCSLVPLLLHVLSYGKLALTNLISPAMFICLAACLVILNSTDICGKTTELMRFHQLYLSTFIYGINVFFLGTTWLVGFATRSGLFICIFSLHQAYRRYVM